MKRLGLDKARSVSVPEAWRAKTQPEMASERPGTARSFRFSGESLRDSLLETRGHFVKCAPGRLPRSGWPVRALMVGWVACASVFGLLEGSARALDAGPATPKNLALLDLQSVDGDDALAAKLSQALRAQAELRPEWALQKQAVSLGQMTLAHGCGTSASLACLKRISRTLQADRVLYGTLHRIAGSRPQSYRLVLKFYNAESGRIDYESDTEVGRGLGSASGRSATADEVLTALLPQTESTTGALTVSGSEGLAIFVDDEVKGFVGMDGYGSVAELPPGTYALELRQQDTVVLRRDVVIQAGKTLAVDAVAVTEAVPEEVLPESEPRADGGPNWRRIGGWTAVGAGAVFLGLTVYSWAQINAINNDPVLQRYREQVPASVTDVCANPEPHGTNPGEFEEVRNLCRRANRLQNVWQWVFLSLGIASTGAGTYLLVTDALRDKEDPTPRAAPHFSLTPSVGWASGGLNLRVVY